jgi:hypothetical protein
MTNKIPSEDRRAELYELIRQSFERGVSSVHAKENLRYFGESWESVWHAFMTPETIELAFRPGADVGTCATCMYNIACQLNKTVTGSINGTVIIMREKKL